MRGSLRDIPGLIRTAEGRRKMRLGIAFRLTPLIRPVARIYRRTVLRKTRVATVVGSFGKTTTRRILAATLRDPAKHSNSLVGTLFEVPIGHPYAVIEAGIDGPGQMAPLARMFGADIAVVTGIGSEHNRSFGTLEATRHEKAEMVRHLSPRGIAVLNGDDPNVLWMASQTRARVVTYGFGEANDVRASEIELDWPRGYRFVVHAGGETRHVQTRFVAQHFIYGFLSAAAVAWVEGIPLDEFARRVENVAPFPGRMQVKELPNGAFLLCDYYKSAQETMHAALDTLAAIPAQRRIVVFGDVNEPRGKESQVYGPLGERIAKIADHAIFVGNSLKRYKAGLHRGGLPKSAVTDAGELVLSAVDALRDLGPGDVVLIKGRSTQRLDRIALALQGRSVACTLVSCNFKIVECAQCKRLERGWDGLVRIT